MKRTSIRNTRLAAAMARMGHYGKMLVGDPTHPTRYEEVEGKVIDLAVSPGLPIAAAVLTALC